MSERERRQAGPEWMLRAVSEGMLRVAQGRYAEGLELLRPLTANKYDPVVRMWAREQAAKARWALGDPHAAILLLEPLGDSRFDAVSGSWTVADWLSCRALLAKLYRATGRNAHADRIGGEIGKLLAAADPGHPLLTHIDQR